MNVKLAAHVPKSSAWIPTEYEPPGVDFVAIGRWVRGYDIITVAFERPGWVVIGVSNLVETVNGRPPTEALCIEVLAECDVHPPLDLDWFTTTGNVRLFYVPARRLG